MVFKLCRNFIGDKHDIVGEKCIKKDDGRTWLASLKLGAIDICKNVTFFHDFK